MEVSTCRYGITYMASHSVTQKDQLLLGPQSIRRRPALNSRKTVSASKDPTPRAINPSRMRRDPSLASQAATGGAMRGPERRECCAGRGPAEVGSSPNQGEPGRAVSAACS